MNNSEKYSLTKTEREILMAAGEASPEKGLSVEAISEKTGISQDRIYEKLQRNEFRELFLEALTNSLAAEVPSILHAFVQQGKSGSFNHGKLLLEITGVYKEKKEIKNRHMLSSDNENPFKDESERKDFVRQTLQRLNEGGQE